MSRYFVDKQDCARHTIFPGVTISAMGGEHMLVSFVEFEPGAIVAEHSHPHEQMGMVLSGKAHFFVGDEDRVLTAGQMYRSPGGVLHRVVAVDGPATALDIFHPVRHEYL